MSIKACIFDLDGVIVDTAKYHYIAWKNIANSLGFDFTLENNERLKGVSRMRSLDILLEIGNIQLSNAEKEHLAKRKNEEYVSIISKMKPNEILPGVVDFLSDLKSQNIKIALGSASKNAPLILERVGLTNFFDAIIDGNSVSKAKPNPEVFLKGAAALKVQANECLVFEDAEAGIEAALAGNMLCIGIGSPEVLTKANYVESGFSHLNAQQVLQRFK